MNAWMIAAVLALGPTTPDLASKSVEALLACSGDAARCMASDWDLARELVQRADTAGLLRIHARAARPQRRVVVFAVYLARRDAEAERLMRRAMRDDDDEVAYYALNYLAKRCDATALGELSAEPYRVRAACEQWATTVRLFGSCRYVPGGPFLVASLGHACGNVVEAAEASLRELFPDAPAKFATSADEKSYFQGRLEPRPRRAASSGTPTREQRELRVADEAILWGLIAQHADAGRRAFESSQLCCESSRIDLALALIGSRDTPDSRAALVTALRWGLDGAGAEDRDCYVLQRGPGIAKELRQASARALAERCNDDVARARAASPELVKGALPENICAGEQRISALLRDLSAAVAKGRRCDPEDF